jgi:hypothetical protein
VFADVDEVLCSAVFELKGLLVGRFVEFLGAMDGVEQSVADDYVVGETPCAEEALFSAAEVLLCAVVFVKDDVADGSGGVVDGFRRGLA